LNSALNKEVEKQNTYQLLGHIHEIQVCPSSTFALCKFHPSRKKVLKKKILLVKKCNFFVHEEQGNCCFNKKRINLEERSTTKKSLPELLGHFFLPRLDPPSGQLLQHYLSRGAVIRDASTRLRSPRLPILF
jgi:hypothetical protein